MVLSFFFFEKFLFSSFQNGMNARQIKKKKKKKVGHGCCVFSHFAGFSLIE